MKYLCIALLLVACGREGKSEDPSPAQPCTATETDEGVTMQCPGQEPVLVRHGQAGQDGADGAAGRTVVGMPGPQGPQGVPGRNAIPCHVQQINSHSAVIMCPDGSSAVLYAPGKGKP